MKKILPTIKNKIKSKSSKITMDYTLPRILFLRRLTRNALFGLLIISATLFTGMVGYHYFESLSWTQSFLEASMILSGMGPVSTLKTESGKIFAGLYALFSGIFFLVTMAIVFAPLIHSFFRKFHLKEES